MAGSIGAVACSFVKGECPPLGMEIPTWRATGHSGYGASKTGLGDGAFRVRAIMFGFNVAPGWALNAWIALIRATRGTTVTITNDRGEAFANCLILRVGEPAWGPAKNSLSDYRVEIPVEGVRTA